MRFVGEKLFSVLDRRILNRVPRPSRQTSLFLPSLLTVQLTDISPYLPSTLTVQRTDISQYLPSVLTVQLTDISPYLPSLLTVQLTDISPYFIYDRGGRFGRGVSPYRYRSHLFVRFVGTIPTADRAVF